jgi:diguanylate cyclase (GGDEF)-like protein
MTGKTEATLRTEMAAECGMTGETGLWNLNFDRDALCRFMPMHLLLDPDERVVSLGPTLLRVLDGGSRVGSRFDDLFEVRVPGGVRSASDVLNRAGVRFRLAPRHRRNISLRGVGQRLQPDGMLLLNLTFGIDLIAAVREFNLTDTDFAATDLAMELLYLAEANAAVTHELRALNLRLEGARHAAEQEALTDPLTGLRNRRAADLVLDQLCDSRLPFGLLHLDLDFFKRVNDSLGHAAGDFVLESVGRILRDQLRAEDCAARIGGDEFVIILPGRTEAKVLQSIARRIIAKVSEPLEFEGNPCRISGSIGIVRSPDLTVPDAAQAMAASDRALYAAKHAGRSRAVLLSADARAATLG